DLVIVQGIIPNVLDHIKRIARETSHNNRQVKMERMKQLVMEKVLDIRRDARVGFYTYHEGPPEALRHDGMWRPGQDRHREEPPKEFIAGTVAGDYMFSILRGLRPVLVSDTKEETGWPSDLDCKTAILAPVADEETPFGLLCIDAPNPRDLKQEDLR